MRINEPAPFRLRLLILEDRPGDRENLADFFKIYARKAGMEVDLRICVFANDVRTELEKSQFHAASLDINVPEGEGGAVEKLGVGAAREMAIKENPPIVVLYTAFPELDGANRIGRETGFPYRVKGAESENIARDGSAVTFEDYAKWFLGHFRRQYVERVLRLLERSGYRPLARQADEALSEGGAFPAASTDNVARNFLRGLDGVREALLNDLVAYVAAVWEMDAPTESRPPPGALEAWLKKAWDKLEQKGDERFRRWRAFMGIPKGVSVRKYYIDETLTPLRRARNDDAHHDRHYTAETCRLLEPALLRLAELMHWFVRRPMMYRIRKLPYNLLRYHELRFAGTPVKETFHRLRPEDIPEGREGVFTRLTDRNDEELIEISRSFQADRNNQGKLFLKRVVV